MTSVDTCEESSLVKAFNTPDTQQYSYETEKAEDLLDKASFPKQLDGWRFKLDHVNITYGDDYRRTGEFARQALCRIGIDVTLRG
jgi:peptide/nickel transport system substrate-binding protein